MNEPPPPGPEDTKPKGTKPEETKPDETKPEETKPEETKPEDKGTRGDVSNTSVLQDMLLEVGIEVWQTISENDRAEFYTTTQKFYHATLEEFRNGANDSVKNFKAFRHSHYKWRLSLICITGGLAALNVLVAYKWPQPANPLTEVSVNQVLSLVAAVYASLLALLTAIESFLNYPDQKTTSRESRELYLDAYRTFEMLWLVRVYPFGYSPEGCLNAAGSYRQLVQKDIELRRKMIDLTETQGKPASRQGP